MEIRIFSAGKEIGPYSESQVRQYLSEGLISGADLAYTEGMTEWQPAGQLLARVAQMQTGSTGESPRAISIRATAPARTKRGPIMLETPFSGGAGRKRSRTGTTALTIEPPRPTTQLPPVAKFIPRDENQLPKRVFDPSPPASTPVVEPPAAQPAQNAPATPPEPENDLLAGEGPPPVPVPDRPPAEPVHEERHKLPAAMWYLSLVAGVIGLGLVAAVVYVIWHFGKAAPHDAQSAISPSSPGAAESTQVTILPHTAADYNARGFSRAEKSDIDGALADYDQALALDPRDAQVLYRRAVARQTKGNWDGALADYNSLLALEPDNADAYSNRGYVKQTQGDFDGALADYTEALTRKPTIAEAFYNVGLIKVRRGDIDGGIEAFNKALEINPRLARVYYNRGNAKNSEGDVDGAIADYTQAMEIDPSNAMACLNRAQARQAKEDATGALADFSQAIVNDANLARAYRGRCEIELRRGDPTTALSDSTQAVALDPNDISSFFDRGLAELGLHNLDAAGGDFNKYCEAAPHGPECDSARLYLWVIMAEHNARDKADDELNYAVLNNWNSSPEDLTSKIANFLVGHIREDELITAASTPDASLEPGRLCRVWFFAGIKRLVAGDTATALADFQKSLATDQKNCNDYQFARSQMVSLAQARQASSQSAAPAP